MKFSNTITERVAVFIAENLFEIALMSFGTYDDLVLNLNNIGIYETREGHSYSNYHINHKEMNQFLYDLRAEWFYYRSSRV